MQDCFGTMHYGPENVREHLIRPDLFMNDLEPIIICCRCNFLLGASKSTVANRFDKEHNVPISTTKELRRLLCPYTFSGLEVLRLCLCGSTAHPHLEVQPRMACKHCHLETISHDVLSYRLLKNHSVKRKSLTWLHN